MANLFIKSNTKRATTAATLFMNGYIVQQIKELKEPNNPKCKTYKYGISYKKPKGEMIVSAEREDD